MATKCPKCQSENSDTAKFCSECATPLTSAGDISVTKTLETPAKGLALGSTFVGRYQIMEELGRGGMGAVYKALDTQINEEVAIKLIRPEIASDEKTLERFSNELKLARKIAHKNVCKMYHLEKGEETPYISMEYLEGQDLKKLIWEKEKLSAEEAIGIAQQVCEGLVEAHRLGVVHRDLKPQNIMIDKEGQAKIMDFGIARSMEAPGVTQTGVIIGTPDYISPEQAEGQEADHRSDIYSLGVILYEMVTGSVPFKGDTALSVALKHKAQLPLDPKKRNPEISDDLSRLILICMEKDKARRYQSAKDLFEDLKNIEHGLPLGTKIKPRRTSYVQTLFQKRLFVPALVIALAIVTTIAILTFRKPEQNLVPNKIVVAVFENQTGDPERNTIGRLAADYISMGLGQTGLIDIVPSMSGDRIYSSYEGEDAIGYLAQETKAGTVVTGRYYLQGDNILFLAQVIDAKKGKVLKSLDPVSGPVEAPTKPIESLQQQLMTELAHSFEPELKDWKGLMYMPSSYEAYKEYLEGRVDFFAFKDKQALDHFLRAADLDPLYAQPRILAAIVHIWRRDFASAEVLVREVDKLSDKLTPYDRYSLDYAKGWIRGDNYMMYNAIAQRLQLASDIPNEKNELAEMAVVVNRPQEAVDLFSQCNPEGPGLKGWYWYWSFFTWAHHMLGNHKQELKVARQGKKQYPNNPEMLWNEVRALAALGRSGDVNRVLDECRSLPQGDQVYVEILTKTANIFRAHGYKDASLQLLERAIKWFESRPKEEAETRSHRESLAIALYRAERWEEAQVLFNDLHTELPNNIYLLRYLGTLAARRGDRDEALRISSLMEKENRPYIFGRHTLIRAQIASLLGEKELSVKLLREALTQGVNCHFGGLMRPYIHPNMDFEPLYDYPPFQELLKPKG